MLFEHTDIFLLDNDHPHCHAPVLVELPGKELMALWYAGQAEAHVSVGLKASWKPTGGAIDAWSKPVLVQKTPGRPDGNAVLVQYRDQLLMFHDVIHARAFPWMNTLLYLKTSTDNGRTWSESKLVSPVKGITVRNKPLVIDDRLLVPVGSEHLLASWSQIIITDDGERFHWSSEIRLPKGRNEQPTLARLGDGSILAYLRPANGWIWESRSTDRGEAWSAPARLGLMNPGSALDFVRTPRGELVLAWNNNQRTKEGGMKSRKCLNIGYSPDEGRTWPSIKEVERDDVDGRFAYPAIIHGSDGLFHLVYTNRRKTIRYCRFDVEWLKHQGTK